MAPLNRSSQLFLAVQLLALLLLGVRVAAAPASTGSFTVQARGAKCTTLRVRKEWRDLTVAERLDYIRAVKCLQATPSKSTRQGVKSRFDEFQASHIDLTDEVHQVGQFLGWHRHFLNLYAKAMREECDYQGPATYWDWSRDADGSGRISASPVFDVTTGFGGDGTGASNPGGGGGFPGGGGRCIQTGPFADFRPRLGPGTAVGEHCLTRAISETMKSSLTSANVRAVLATSPFETFRQRLENGGQGIGGFGIHGGGHAAVGGEMVNPYSSPGDPLFYLHHGNLDRVWWKWQSTDPAKRLNDLSGPTTQRPPFTNVTLDFLMPFTTLAQPLAVREIMNIESEPSCYRYNDLPA